MFTNRYLIILIDCVIIVANIVNIMKWGSISYPDQRLKIIIIMIIIYYYSYYAHMVLKACLGR